MEEPPGSNRGKKVEAYQDSVDINPGDFWCAAFLYWCFQKAAENLGKKNPVLKTGHCMTHWRDTPGKKIAAADAVNKPSLIKRGQIFIINTRRLSRPHGIGRKSRWRFYTYHGR